MVTKLELMNLSKPLADLYKGLETDLIINIAQWLKNGDINASTPQWKMQLLARLGALDKANIKLIAEYAGLAPEMLEVALETAALTSVSEFEPGFQKLAKEGIINGTEVPIEKTMARALTAYHNQAKSSLNMVNTVMRYKAKTMAQKLVNDAAELAGKQSFLDMLNKATGKVVTGTESRQAAVRQCISEMAEKGIPAFVDKRGREWSPEAYINMDVRTTANNVAHQAQLERMDDYDIDLIEVSSHSGARPKCAKDQGKIFNRKNKDGYTTDLHGRKIRYYSWAKSSYGEPDGILGINCGHHIYPFIPGASYQTYFPYDEYENQEEYKKLQTQRELERRVRKSKHECASLEAVGDEEGLKAAKLKLRDRQKALKQYCNDNNLRYKPDRTAVQNYKKTTAGFVSKAEKEKLENLREKISESVDKSGVSGIINNNNTTGTADIDVHKIGKIDIEKYKCITKDIQTDEVVITDERIQHIKERHPNHFEKYCQYMKEIIETPDYIIEANKPNTALILKSFSQGNEQFKTILRLVTSNDNSEFKNSIITFMKINEKEWNRLIRNKKILYKSE